MKNLYAFILLVALFPVVALATPKQRVTIPLLKKKVAELVAVRDALKLELAALKESHKKVQDQLAYCTAHPVIEYRASQATPQIVTLPVVVSNAETPKRKINITAYPITDKVEVNGLETVIAVGIQIQNVTVADKIELQGGNITSSFYENGSQFYTLAPVAVKLTLIINGNAFFPEVVILDSPDGNSNKRVQLLNTVNIEV